MAKYSYKDAGDIIGGDYFNDLERTGARIKVLVCNDKEYVMQASDDYGMWAIKTPKKLPAEIDGNFTSHERLERAIVAYHDGLTLEESRKEKAKAQAESLATAHGLGIPSSPKQRVKMIDEVLKKD